MKRTYKKSKAKNNMCECACYQEESDENFTNIISIIFDIEYKLHILTYYSSSYSVSQIRLVVHMFTLCNGYRISLERKRYRVQIPPGTKIFI